MGGNGAGRARQPRHDQDVTESGPSVSVAAGAGRSRSRALVVRTADVTDLLGDARSIMCSRSPRARRAFGGNFDVNTAPMAAWTLTVIWSDPNGAVSATVSARVGGQLSSAGHDSAVDRRRCRRARSRVNAAFFGTDPWGRKSLSPRAAASWPRDLWGAR